MKKLFLILIFSGFLTIFSSVFASSSERQPLPADQAFQLSADLGDSIIKLHWKIHPGHYLYRDRLHFSLLKPDTASIGRILLPPAALKKDKYFGKFQAYPRDFSVSLPVLNSQNADMLLQVSYQGCSNAGYCYPPEIRQIRANFAKNTVTIQPAIVSPANEALSEQDKLTQLLKGQHYLTILLAFLGIGLLLAFTPCVLPMIPILSSIIVGNHATLNPKKTFRLSLVYVLSMSVTYAIAGLAIGKMGANLQTTLQQPWIIVLFSLIFGLLALSLFGFYNLEPPKKLQHYLSKLSNKQAHGHYLGVAVMGCLATLIVSPCVTPALVGALAYISQSGNGLLGGIALFATGFGMGIPLLLIGISGGKLLPKVGAWMNTVKYILGVLLLALAIQMLSRIIPGPFSLLLWAALLITCGIYMGALITQHQSNWSKLWQGIGLLLLIYGILLIVGAAMGNNDLFQPIPLKKENTLSNPGTPRFTVVKNNKELEQQLLWARQKKQPVLIDFYAQWCLSCRSMEEYTFANFQIKQALNNFVLIKIDVTENNYNTQNLLKYFNVIAPPTFIFFNAQGEELKNLRVVGEMGAKKFLGHLKQVLNS